MCPSQTVSKVDLKKQFPDFYNCAVNKVQEIDIPPMKYYMVDGHGDPNKAQAFQDAVQTLYAVSYTLKMTYKKEPKGKDYVVPPLEGLWFMNNMAEWSMEHKENWDWTMIIRVPDFVPDEKAQKAMVDVKTKKAEKAPLIDKLRLEYYQEGKCVQIMHIGPYDAETANIEKLHKYAKDQKFQLSGKHHEIYLSDPRKAKPEKMRTVIRQPVK